MVWIDLLRLRYGTQSLQIEAIYGLVRSSKPKALQALVRILRRSTPELSSTIMRALLAKQRSLIFVLSDLERNRDSGSCAALEEALASLGHEWQNKTEAAIAIAATLEVLGSKSGLDWLISRLTSGTAMWARRDVARTLGERKQPEALPALCQTMRDVRFSGFDTASLRKTAAEVLVGFPGVDPDTAAEAKRVVEDFDKILKFANAQEQGKDEQRYGQGDYADMIWWLRGVLKHLEETLSSTDARISTIRIEVADTPSGEFENPPYGEQIVWWLRGPIARATALREVPGLLGSLRRDLTPHGIAVAFSGYEESTLGKCLSFNFCQITVGLEDAVRTLEAQTNRGKERFQVARAEELKALQELSAWKAMFRADTSHCPRCGSTDIGQRSYYSEFMETTDNYVVCRGCSLEAPL